MNDPDKINKLDPSVPLSEDHPEYKSVPETDVGKRPSGYYCMSRKKNQENGAYCTLRAGHGTDHSGVGRCKRHGGSSVVKHGYYSQLKRYSRLGGSIGELYDKYMDSDDDPLDIEPELALTRAIIEDFISDYGEMKESLFAWRDAYAENYDVDPPKLNIPSLHSAYKMLDSLSKMVDREQRRKEASAISLKELYRLMGSMSVVVREAINDDSLNNTEKLRKISKEWGKLSPK